MHRLITFFTIILLAIAFTSLIASAWVLTSLSPETDSKNVIWLYASTGLFVFSLLSWALFAFRQKFGLREFVSQHIFLSLRQGFLITLMFLASMILQEHRLFTWLNAAFLVVALSFLEGYFLYRSKNSPNNLEQ